ncbi:MAG: succinate-semialdehyde dehydrogenase, partial [Gemmatimonadetes bacterium]
MTVASINPTTGETLETFAETTPAALERVLDQALAAYQSWSRCSYAQRAQAMREAGRLLRERKTQHARTMALEMGKPLMQGEAEAEKCAWVCDYYAEHAERFLADEPRETDASKAFVRFDPIGPVLAIMPWNFPFWQVFRFAAPALMAGNAGLLKHAPNVTRCALGIEAIFQEAGFPEGLFRALILSNEAAATVI